LQRLTQLDDSGMPASHLTVAIASSALFDLQDGDQVFRTQGRHAYIRYQLEHEHAVLKPGVAFPFIRRLLMLNHIASSHPLVDVVLLSRNDPETGIRVHNSLSHHGLKIERSVFTGGRPPYPFIKEFGASLFLSANHQDVEEAIRLGYPAGRVMPGETVDDAGEELRIAFDFDGVVAGDEAERVYQERGLEDFHANENSNALEALSPGPLKPLLTHIAKLQEMEVARAQAHPDYQPIIRTSIITARDGRASRRVVSSLRAWGIRVDESYFIGNLAKSGFIRTFRPHIFFDDKLDNVLPAACEVPSVHIPFGISNKR
jgi:5'-nucleotidase